MHDLSKHDQREKNQQAFKFFILINRGLHLKIIANNNFSLHFYTLQNPRNYYSKKKMKSSRTGYVIAMVAVLMLLVNAVSAQDNQRLKCYKDCIKQCGRGADCDTLCVRRCGDKSVSVADVGTGAGEVVAETYGAKE